jgi:hypothetical protein
MPKKCQNFGQYFDRIQKIIGGRDIVLMEDNCESLGATFKGKKAGRENSQFRCGLNQSWTHRSMPEQGN